MVTKKKKVNIDTLFKTFLVTLYKPLDTPHEGKIVKNYKKKKSKSNQHQIKIYQTYFANYIKNCFLNKNIFFT